MRNPESALAFLLILESMEHRERVLFKASNGLCEKYGQEINIEVYKTRLPFEKNKYNVTINLVDTNGDLLKDSDGKPATKAKNLHLFDKEYTEKVYGMINPKNITKNRDFIMAEIATKPKKEKPEGYIPGRRGPKPNPDKQVESKKTVDILSKLIPMDEPVAELPKATRKKSTPVVEVVAVVEKPKASRPKAVVAPVVEVVAELPKATRKKSTPVVEVVAVVEKPKKPDTVVKVSEKVGAEVSMPIVSKSSKKKQDQTEFDAQLAKIATLK